MTLPKAIYMHIHQLQMQKVQICLTPQQNGNDMIGMD